MAAAPHLDGHYAIFGEVVRGMDIAREINSYAKGKKDNTAGCLLYTSPSPRDNR